MFWLATLSIATVATFLAIHVETHRNRSRGVEVPADLKDGDLVDVVLVVNGDELMVEHNHQRAKIRMLGIRSFDPVVNEFEITAFGRGAVAFLQNWVVGHEVKVTFDVTIKDIHGRYLAYVERDGTDVNQRMLEEGLAMVYTEYPFARESHYLSEESFIRTMHRGIWASDKAIARTKALRRDWAASRRQRSDGRVFDPLGAW